MRKSGCSEEAITQYTRFTKDFVVHVKPDQLRSWAQANVFLALSYTLLGAKALGFDSCSMGGFDPEAYTTILKLPPTLISTMLCAWCIPPIHPIPRSACH